MPKIIIWIVTGFSFLKTFHFVALKQNSTDIDHILTSSLVVGYVYCNIAYLIPFSISYYIDNILMVLTSIIIGYFVGKISISRKITPILDRLGILDTGNIFLWDDLMDKKYPMKICITCDDSKYEGIAHNIESYSNSPHIALSSYIIYDKDGKIIENHSKNNRRVIIIDTAASKKVEIIYDKDSDECKDIQLLCDYNKKYNL